MNTPLKYYSYLERPTIDAFSNGYVPKEGFANTLLTFWIQVTGESGAEYNLIRAVGMPTKDKVLNFGFFKGSGNIDERAEHVIDPRELPVVEPFWSEHRGDAIVYGNDNFEIAMYDDRYEWSDAGGRVQITATRLGQACTAYVPPQEGFEPGWLDRSHLCFAEGTIDGEPVRGMFMDDHLYGRPGWNLRQGQMVEKIENYWTQWLVEYSDGTFEGGSVWKGQPGTNFWHAHHYVDGRSRARQDVRFTVERNEKGSMKQLNLQLGRDASFVFEQAGAYDWPFHTYGKVASTSRDSEVVNSWQYIENWPTNMYKIEAFQEVYQTLYGRPASLRKMVEGAHFDENDALILVPQDISTGR